MKNNIVKRCQPPARVGNYPKCGEQPFLQKTNYGNRWFCCDVWSWGKNPMADRETHDARKQAHLIFDRLWKSGHVTRSKAYEMLAEELNLTKEQCHMTMMPFDVAKKVPNVTRKIWGKLDARN